MKAFFYCCLGSTLWLFSCKGTGNNKDIAAGSDDAAPVIAYVVVKKLPHDTNSFTEGLLVHEGQLFESTGHTDSYPASRSLFGVFNQRTGRIDVKAEIDKKKYFGEGIVFLEDKVYQLTDSTHIGFVYDAHSFKKLADFNYSGEGWGLTTDGRYLLMSNGSSNIVYRNPGNFLIVKTLNVADNNGPVSNINELELINGYLYANQWLTNYIYKIDTASGRVLGKLDLTALAVEARIEYPGAAELNGIAFDATADKIYITGKLWPALYEIKFDH